MTSKTTLADYGLVGLVGGGIAMLLVGMATLGISAFVGKIPIFLGVLLGVATAITVVSLGITIATRQR